MSAFRHAMFYGVYGPLIGAAVLFLVIVPMTFGVGKEGGVAGYLALVPGILVMSIWIVPVALVLGIVPGIITGLVHWWLGAHTSLAQSPSLARAAVMSLAGGAICVLFGVCLGAAASDMVSIEILQLFIAPGMAAGFGCALLIDRRARKWALETAPERPHGE